MLPKPKSKKDPGFSEWLEELATQKIQKIQDPERRAAFEKVLKVAEEDGETEEVLREVFRGGLRDAEFYRRLTALTEVEKARESEHQKWLDFRDEVKEKHEKVLAENEALKKELDERTAALRAVGLEKEADDLAKRGSKALESADTERLINRLTEAEKRVIEAEEGLRRVSAGAPVFTVDFLDKARQLEKEGLDVDLKKVYNRIAESRGALSIDVAFEDEVRPQRVAKDKKEREEAIAKAKEEGRQEALTQRVAPDALRERMSGVFKSAGTSSTDKLQSARSEAAKLVAQFQTPGL